MSTIYRAAQVLTMTGWESKPQLQAGDNLEARDHHLLGLIEEGAVLVEGGEVKWVGPARDCPPANETISCQLITPAWVECHSHAIYAGNRAHEFALRNAGAAYVDILEAGGGIHATVAATTRTSDQRLLQLLLERARDFAAQGVGVLEVKSGYGLAPEEELRQLEVIAKAQQESPIQLVPTYLAHTIPERHQGAPQIYVDQIVNELLPEIARRKLAVACDVFCDRGAFDLASSRRILEAAKALGLGLRIHAEELSYTGGAAMAAELGATSADHLEHIDEAGIAALATTGCVGVLLPGVTTFLDMPHRAPARSMIEAGGAVALSSDLNPGSCCSSNMALMSSLGCSLLKLTPGESLWALTRGAALAMGLDGGQILAGKAASLACFDGITRYEDIPYRLGEKLQAAHLIHPYNVSV